MTTPRPAAFRTIGDFDLLESIGAGGMGVVYRAHDRRLGRDVAIKLLPDGLASDPTRLARFQREAKLLATLSHPHIGAIHGLIESEGTSALVLELIEGETLAARIARGPLRVADALPIAIQILDALDHVHQRGIVHRDLKPSNVMLTKSGVKLLDFGVGKFTPGADVAAGLEGMATDTATGQVVGTLHYMAPEQLEGREVGPRSDLFAVGAMFHEMLTGRKAFDGGAPAAVVAAILGAAPPPLSSSSHDVVPPRLDRVVAKCLEKDPDRRWQSARDLSDALGWIRDESSAGALPPRRTPPRLLWPIAAGVTLVAALSIAAMGWPWRSSTATPADATPAPVRFVIQAPAGISLGRFDFDISADGRVVFYRALGDGPAFVRRLDSFTNALSLPPARRASPTLSSDAESLAYVAMDTVYRLPLRGDHPAVPLATVPGGAMQLQWPTPDMLLFAAPEYPIRRLSAAGGSPEPVTQINAPSEVDHHTPWLLPGGRALLFGIHLQRNRFAVGVRQLETGEQKTVIDDAFSPTYLPTGHLVFARGSTIMAAPFDVNTLTVTGVPVAVLTGVHSVPASGVASYRVSETGTLVYLPAAPDSPRAFVWVDRRGVETPVPIAAGAFESPRISPDGTRFAFASFGAGTETRRIMIYESATGNLTPLTIENDAWGPAWLPDGAAVVYGTDRTDASHVMRQGFDGTTATSIGWSVNHLWPAGFDAAGAAVVVEIPPTDAARLSRLVSGSSTPQPVIEGPSEPNEARVSSDGRWLAYQGSDAASSPSSGGTLQIFVEPASGKGPKRQVTVDGGGSPVWSRNGRELFFMRRRQVWSISLQRDGFNWGRPVLLLEGDFANSIDAAHGSADYDVHPDGRFLMLKPTAPASTPTQLNVVLNWSSEVQARLAGKR